VISAVNRATARGAMSVAALSAAPMSRISSD
jgi:hypothetical protein